MKSNLLQSKFFLLLLFCPFLLNAQLGINSDNSAPSTNSMLDVKSSTKGILIPRISGDLGSPTEGLLYYNTTGHNFRYYDGTAWQNALFGNQWNINSTSISYSLGNVGIGTNSPVASLNLYKSDGSNMIFQNLATGTTITDGFFIGHNTGGSTKSFIWNYEPSSIGIGTNGIERVTISSSGNVGIGTTSPTVDLHVNGNGYFGTTLEVGSNFYVYGNTSMSGNQNVNGTFNANGQLNANADLAVDGNTTTNNGKGIVRSDDASQMVIKHVTSPANLNVTLSAGAMSNSFSFVFGETFASPPSIAWGRTTGIDHPQNMILTIESISTTQAIVRFKNVGLVTTTVSYGSVSGMVIGKK